MLASAYAALQVMLKSDLLGNVQRMHPHLKAGMQQLLDDHPSVKQARCVGLFGCLDIQKNRRGARKRPSPRIGWGYRWPRLRVMTTADYGCPARLPRTPARTPARTQASSSPVLPALRRPPWSSLRRYGIAGQPTHVPTP